MNRETKWSVAEIMLAMVNTLAFVPVMFFILLLIIRAPKDTLDFITLPLLFFTVSMFLLNFIASAWQFDRHRKAAKLLFGAGVGLFLFSILLLSYQFK